MPVYEYKCKTCEQIFEFKQKMTDPPKTVCGECCGRLERQISKTSFQLTGGCWAKDGYR